MNQHVLNIKDLYSMLGEVASDLISHSEELRQLDAATGDGDMGVTAELGGKALQDYLASSDEDNIGHLLIKCGMHINTVSPSTFGTLLASAFMGAGNATRSKTDIDIKDLIAAGEGAIDGIKKRGKAEVGGKTIA